MATRTDVLVGRPTFEQTRKRLLDELEDGGIAVAEVNRYGELLTPYLNEQSQRMLRELLAEGSINFVKVPIALSDRYVLTATKGEQLDLSYDRFSEPRSPIVKDVPGGTVPTYLEPA